MELSIIRTWHSVSQMHVRWRTRLNAGRSRAQVSAGRRLRIVWTGFCGAYGGSLSERGTAGGLNECSVHHLGRTIHHSFSVALENGRVPSARRRGLTDRPDLASPNSASRYTLPRGFRHVHRHCRSDSSEHHHRLISASALVRHQHVGPALGYLHARHSLPRKVSGCNCGAH